MFVLLNNFYPSTHSPPLYTHMLKTDILNINGIMLVILFWNLFFYLIDLRFVPYYIQICFILFNSHATLHCMDTPQFILFQYRIITNNGTVSRTIVWWAVRMSTGHIPRRELIIRSNGTHILHFDRYWQNLSEIATDFPSHQWSRKRPNSPYLYHHIIRLQNFYLLVKW